MTREQRDAIYVWIDNGGPLSAGLEPAVREVLLRQDDSAATVRAWAKRMRFHARSSGKYLPGPLACLAVRVFMGSGGCFFRNEKRVIPGFELGQIPSTREHTPERDSAHSKGASVPADAWEAGVAPDFEFAVVVWLWHLLLRGFHFYSRTLNYQVKIPEIENFFSRLQIGFIASLA